MVNTLNITNGGCTVAVMKEAAIPGKHLPWRDLLHDGPVPAKPSLEELSKARIAFIVEQGYGTIEEIRESFETRDNTLKSIKNYKKVILWFEHDLYDQLQLLQILNWLHKNPAPEVTLSIISIDQYLGQLSSNEMVGLLNKEAPITNEQLTLAHKAWTAFCSDTPKQWYALLSTDTTSLPFLKGAIVRLLEEYPSSTNGLSRTARQALEIISKGEKHPAKIFSANQALEERIFLGDSSFWKKLQELRESNPPLIELSNGNSLTLPASPDQELTITPTGKAVLSGTKNWLELIEQDQWIGGVHLTPENSWYWDSNTSALTSSNNSHPLWQYNEFNQIGTDYSDKAEVENYDASHSDFRDIEAEGLTVLDALGIKRGDRLIDFGAGTGSFAILAAPHCTQVHAVDVSQAMLNHAKNKATQAEISNIYFHHAGFLTYEHTSPPVDAIITTFAFHHLPDFWKGVALKRLIPMLKPDGQLYIHDVILEESNAINNIQALINKLSRAGGEFLQQDTERHFKEEHSTYDWVMDELLLRAGFAIKQKQIDDGVLGTYICTKS